VVQQHVLEALHRAEIGIVLAAQEALIETIAAVAQVTIVVRVYIHTLNIAADILLFGQETPQDN
jgi:hypothetical protein